MTARKQQEQAKPKASAPSRPKKDAGKKDNSKKDNPYARPFGRLSPAELEKAISDTEAALAAAQAKFADAELFKDAARGQKLHEDYAALEKKLRQLEEEYFTRGQ